MDQRYKSVSKVKEYSWRDDRPLDASIDQARTRLLALGVIFLLGFLAIGVRLGGVMLWQTDASRGHLNTADQASGKRQDIHDRDGYVLATSVKTYSVYANPKLILDAADAAKKLTILFPVLSQSVLVKRLSSEKSFVWIARHLTPVKQRQVLNLGIPGVYLQPDARRVYPHGALFSHVLGVTNIDNQGVSGMEKKLETQLMGEGKPLVTTLSLRLQHILRQAIQDGIAEFDAIGGNGMIMDIRTGEILAMVSLPDFDPNKPGGTPPDNLFNRNTLGVYEMGSTFKLINTALALEFGAKLTSTYDASHPLRIGRFTVKDLNAKNRVLTLEEAFLFSSNIANLKMMLEVGHIKQMAFFKQLGLFTPFPLELPEIGTSHAIFPWKEVNAITASYGYGIMVTPLHFMRAATLIINEGRMPQFTLLKRESESVILEDTGIVSASTSKAMRHLLRQVAVVGTGRKANVPGYAVGVKTGTANKLKGRVYKEKCNRCSALAALPVDNPRYLLIVMLDEPKASKATAGYATAGWNAAKVMGHVISRAVTVLNIAPDITELPKGEGSALWLQSHYDQDTITESPHDDVMQLLEAYDNAQ